MSHYRIRIFGEPGVFGNRFFFDLKHAHARKQRKHHRKMRRRRIRRHVERLPEPRLSRRKMTAGRHYDDRDEQRHHRRWRRRRRRRRRRKSGLFFVLRMRWRRRRRSMIVRWRRRGMTSLRMVSGCGRKQRLSEYRRNRLKRRFGRRKLCRKMRSRMIALSQRRRRSQRHGELFPHFWRGRRARLSGSYVKREYHVDSQRHETMSFQLNTENPLSGRSSKNPP